MGLAKLCRLGLLTGAALSMLACGTPVRYEITPPATEQGRACVVQCAGIRETCMGNETRKASQEKEMCEKTSDIQYSSCIAKATNRDQEKECLRKRRYCYASEDTYRCKNDYDACFVNCGGVIKEISEEKK
jgi:hypothetical protein